MHGDKFIVKFQTDKIEVKNITNNLLENCMIQVSNLFSKDIFKNVCDFLPGEIKSFDILHFNFSEEYINESFSVNVYHNHKLCYHKKFNDKTKCYVLLSNKSFEKITEQLIIGLNRYSNIDILHYTVDYVSDLNYTNLTNIEFSIKGDSSDANHMQFAKPSILMNVLERGYSAGVFIDSDIQIRSNVDNLFDYISEIEDGPIFNKGYWDFTVVHNMYIPGPLLTEAMGGLPNQKAPQGITNILIFNKSHYDLFKEWEEVCFSESVNNIKKVEFLHDELILNCMLWKKGIKPKQYFLATNISSIKDVEFFYNHNFNTYDDTDLNTYGKGYYAQSFLPYNKKSVVGFHCIKDAETAKKINSLIYRKEIEKSFEQDLFSFYEDINKAETRIKNIEFKPAIINHYVRGPYIEIRGKTDKEYNARFINGKGDVVFSSNLKSGHWAAVTAKYFDNYTCEVYRIDNGELVYRDEYDAADKRVYIALDSNSLGDTMAWVPYAEEFRKKHGCKMILSTFMNELFEEQYPEIEFVNPGTNVGGLYAMYTIGWYYNEDGTVDFSRNPREFKNLPLQQTATDILGLEYKEVKPLLKVPDAVKKKKVGIGFHSTAQPKYWNNPTGWQEVTDFLISEGYEVVIYSKEGDSYMGNYFPKGATKFEATTIENLIKDMVTCEFFIGIGSGLSWLAWSINLPVILISGFSEAYSEPIEGITRVINEDPNVCRGCFNRFRLDAGDWNWCPEHKGTDRQFECTKTITGEMVISKIKHFKSHK